LTIHAVYDAGLEGAPFGGGGNALWEKVMLRFIAHDPCWYDDRQACQVLGYSQTVANANKVLQRKLGIWSSMNYGLDVEPLVSVAAPNGLIYFGGSFANAGNAAAFDVNCPGIMSWSGSAWAAVGAGCNGAVRALALGPDGSLYLGGNFTLAGGVANTAYIAKWNGSVFTPLGTGMDGSVQCLCMDASGNLYAGGSFTHAGGTAANRIAKWDGSTWSALGTGCDDIVYALGVGFDNYLYTGGVFATANGVTVHGIAKWTGTTFTTLSGGITGGGVTVYALTFGLDGRLYIGGDFTSAGGVAASNIAVWNGTAFSSLGTGITGASSAVKNMATAINGSIYAAGTMTAAGGLTLPGPIAYWTGSSWLPLDVNESAATENRALAFDARGNLYMGYNGAGTVTSATVTIPTNASTRTYPRFQMYHYNATGATATLYQIVNYTTGRSIYFKNLQLLHGELIVFDLTPGKVNIWSNWRGNLANYILGGSNLDFYIQPGNNNISAYLIGGTADDYIYMFWNNTFWSNDGVA
jgi:hypothetical protein